VRERGAPHRRDSRMREKVELRDVTADNWRAVVDLELEPDQEDLVDDNASSLKEARFDPDARPRVIYAGGRVVGFLMYDAGRPRDKPREATIYRFMIDRRHQHAGYGRAALNAALAEIRAIPKVVKISISYLPDNPVAKPFYASFGFREVGLDEDGEMVAELAL
jgi:diamine N-acetyltransferase